MTLFRTVYYWFSQYVNPAERRVGRFLSRVSERDTSHKTQQALIALLQQYSAVVNVWSEARYKGYAYLTKKKRRQLYDNLERIHADFAAYCAAQVVSADEVFSTIRDLGVDTLKIRQYSEQIVYLACIMRYLSPQRGHYVYRDASSFGRLLQDPATHQLEGDCNQIVTLYISLYGAKYAVHDLSLRVYPGHVALHFHGVDIEATTGAFMKYDKPEQSIVPVQEIVSINLLDTTDANFKKNAVKPEIFLQAARLAYVLSSHRSLVEKNLTIAYHNTIRQCMVRNEYAAALTYARQSRDLEYIELAAYNGALYKMKSGDFRAARKFAQSSHKKRALIRHIDEAEAAQCFNAKKYKEAATLYARSGQPEMVKRCYEALFFEEQRLLRGVTTVADIKGHARTVRTMQDYAKRSGNAKLIEHVRTLTKYL